MLKIIYILLFLSLCACSQLEVREPRKLLGRTLSPGQVIFVQEQGVRGDALFCSEQEIPIYKTERKVSFFLVESYFSKREKFSCFFTLGKRKTEFFDVEVVEKDYPSEKLYVDSKRVSLSPESLQRVQRERAILAKVYEKSSEIPLFEKGFKLPLESFITSDYGKRRVFNDVKKTQHLGTDFRGGVGKPIENSNSGMVVFSGKLFYTGYTVIIDHGLGVFTMYGHLNKIYVQAGQYIKQGELLGEVGRTGRVTGPHLHWGAKIHGSWVDPMTLVSVSKGLLSF